MLVPDNFSFSMQDILNVTGYSDLWSAYNYSEYSWRDYNYWGVYEGMWQFRNYGPKGYIYVYPSQVNFDQYAYAYYGENTFTVESSEDWSMDFDYSEITNYGISPSSGGPGSTLCYISVNEYNYSSITHLASVLVHNGPYTLTNYITICQDGNYYTCQ